MEDRQKLHTRDISQAMVLLSGGMDSAACLAFLQSQNVRSSCLFINYGQPAAAREYEAASAISEFYKVLLRCVTVSGFRKWGVGFVPGRNAFLLHTALMATDFPSGI